MQQPLLAKLVRGAGAALTIQVISAGAIYSLQVLLARWMGTAEYGIYDYATAVGVFLAFIAGLGLPSAVLRFIPQYAAHQDWAHLRGIMWGSWQQTVIVSILTSSGGTAILLMMNAAQSLEDYTVPLIVGIWTLPTVALANLQKEIVRACGQIAIAYAPSLIIHPLLLMSIAFLWQRRQQLTGTATLTLSLLAALLALAMQLVLFQQNLDTRIRTVRPAYAIVEWWQVALPLMFLDGSHMVLSQTDTLMIGALLNAEQVGIYSAALKTSLWVPFILSAVNAIAAPMFASLSAQGDRRSLQQLVSTVARWMFYPALAIALALIGFAEPVLQLFGPEFTAARGALIILILGQLVNVGAGSVGYLMMMTGHHTQSALVMGASAGVNVILNLIGIHLFGIVGAALATALSMALWNVWLHALVVQRLGVRPSILAAWR
ncbi:MAG: lipopolysaccharide biosynthesis protein [Cyanophyceae cyanobacterium]